MKREPINTPFLHKSKDTDYMDSIAIFKLILRFMNDESLSPKREQALADYIIHKVQNAIWRVLIDLRDDSRPNACPFLTDLP